MKPSGYLLAEIGESFRMALAALAAHKLRSALTLLGVMVGVFSIIVVTTAMRALQSNTESKLAQLGTDTFLVHKVPIVMVGGHDAWRKYRHRENLRYALYQQLRDRVTLARAVGAEGTFQGGEISSRFEKSNPEVTMTGITPEVMEARDWVVEEGRGLTASDLDSGRSVCLISASLARKLFPFGGALGERVKWHGYNYTVVGILEDKGGMGGASQDLQMLVPLTTALNRTSWRWDLVYLVRAWDQASLDDTIEQVRGSLRTLRKVAPGAEDNFEISTNDSLIRQFRSLTFAIRIGVAVVSSISLLAAGVGIMNIMLVSVTERTREIGIRRAVGAKKRNLLTQFILEAVVICQVGGLLGVLLGVLGGNLVARHLEVATVIPVDWMIYGLIICSLVGILFGTYPAMKAANLDPIESLRYE